MMTLVKLINNLRIFKNQNSGLTIKELQISAFFFFILLTKITAQSDEIKFTHITAEDGLSLNSVTKILQDKHGFIWLGTNHGLNRFDGHDFKVFLPEQDNPNSITSHSIWSLYEDSKGYIWIGTNDGLNRYDWKTEKFYKYKNKQNDTNSLSGNIIYSIYEDQKGTIWIGTQNGLNKYNREKDNFTVNKKVSDEFNQDSFNAVTAINCDKEGNMWLGTWKGLTCFQNDGKIKYLRLPEIKKQRTSYFNEIWSIVPDNLNNLWIGTSSRGLFRYNCKTGKFINYYNKPGEIFSITGNVVKALYLDKYNNLWIGTQNGLNKFDLNQNVITKYFNDPDKSTSISNNDILSIYEDRTSNIWVGSFGGVSRFNNSISQFKYFQRKKGDINSLSSNDINSIFIDGNDEVWVGTTDGLNKLRLGSDFVVKYLNNNKNSNSLNDNYIRAVLRDHNGLVWIGTSIGGLNCFDSAANKFTAYKHDERDTGTISNNGVVSLLEDRNGNIWVGTWWGANRFDRSTGKFARFNEVFMNKTIWTIYEDSKGILWFGTDGSGVYMYNPESNSFTNYLYDSLNTSIISGSRISTICESRDGILWFGTMGGLKSYNRIKGKFITYNKENGLPSVLINGIIEDDSGNLWISTDKGISKFDRKRGIFINFSKRSGLKNLEFAPRAFGKTSNGTLIFGSRGGIVYFHPDSIKHEHISAPVVFTDLKINNQTVPVNSESILKESLLNAKSIVIPPGNDVITLDFAMLDYFDPKHNTFCYMLKGFESKWNNIGNRNSVTYINLPPGEYDFLLRAFSENGSKNNNELSLKIIIVPVFYQTWWFKILLGVIVSLIVVLFYQLRTRTIIKRNKQLENKVNERTKDLDKTINELSLEISTKDKFFSIIAHDLRSPFTGLLGLSKYLVNELDNLTKDELKMISENIAKSAENTFELLENLLNWARIKTGRINYEPEVINLKNVFNELSELYGENAAYKDITLDVKVCDDMKIVADLNMIKSVLRNLISNSIKFTRRGGKINISVRKEDAFITISVADSGVGIHPDKINRLFQVGENVSTNGTENEKGSGLGLILCKEFIELNGGKILVKSKLGEGTEFSLLLKSA